MSDAPLRGSTVLTIGGSEPALTAIRDELSGAGAVLLGHAPDAQAALTTLAAVRVDAILALEDVRSVAARIDPLGVGGGPLLIDAGDVVDGPARGVAVALERHVLRERAGELEAVIAAQAVAARREQDAADRSSLRRIALLAELRDDNTHQHTERVGHLAGLLARSLGMAPRTVGLIRIAAPLHDIGKVAIPDEILLKPERLDPEEYEVVKSHAAIGARILGGGSSELMQTAEALVRSHHERWDGGGYPDGLVGEAIPLAGRLVAVADVFDVLVHERPYKDEWSVQDAAAEIRAGAGSQFDPEVVTAFDLVGERGWRSSPV